MRRGAGRAPAARADKIFKIGLFIEMPFDAHCRLTLQTGVEALRSSKRRTWTLSTFA
jgi:hypothetical protein